MSGNVSINDLYRRSSQYKLWSYTEDTLEQLKQRTNENGRGYAIKKFNQAYESMKSENKALFDKYPTELDPNLLLELISMQEEHKYLDFYEKNVLTAATYFKMSTQVKSTALSFFKRFYLVNSVMQYHPKNILYTCLFLAAKSENYFIAIDTFCKGLQNTEPKDILDLEFIVLQSLKFTLLVHHPFRPLYGFFLDFQQILSGQDATVDEIGELYDNAKEWLNSYGLLSDVCFLYTPPQIALTAMYDCNPKITGMYLALKFPKSDQDADENADKNASQSTNLSYPILIEIIERCILLAKRQIDSTKEECTKIDRKCFFLIHPEKLIRKKIKKLKATNDI